MLVSWSAIRHFVFAPQCVVTGVFLRWPTAIDNLADEVLLARCASVCPVCAAFSWDGGICGGCLRHPPAFDSTQVQFLFKDDLRDLIHRFKFQQAHYCVQVLADLMLLNLEVRGVQALLPVPLHLSRLRERGFNQSLELAKRVSQKTGVPIVDEGLVRLRATPSQATLSAKERHVNLKGAFGVCVEKLQGLVKVAIIDDVMTTGATMQALASLLKQRTDIEWVEAWVVAKTPK